MYLPKIKNLFGLFLFLSLVVTLHHTTLHANALSDSYLAKIQKQPPLTFKQLIAKKLSPLNFKKGSDTNSEIESVFIESFADNDQTAIDIANTKQHEYFIAAKNYALAIYNVDNGFFKYAVLFKPDGTVNKVILLTYRFGNNAFLVKRDYKMGIAREITFLVEETRHDRGDAKESLSYKEQYFLTLKPDATLTIKHGKK